MMLLAASARETIARRHNHKSAQASQIRKTNQRTRAVRKRLTQVPDSQFFPGHCALKESAGDVCPKRFAGMAARRYRLLAVLQVLSGRRRCMPTRLVLLMQIGRR